MRANRIASGIPVACPRCGETLASGTSSSPIDKPLQECANCGGILVRAGVREWGLLGPGEKFAVVARLALMVLAVGLALPLAHAVAVSINDRRWELRESLACLAIGVLLASAIPVSKFAKRIRESNRRMRDPMYLAKLAQREIVEATRR